MLIFYFFVEIGFLVNTGTSPVDTGTSLVNTGSRRETTEIGRKQVDVWGGNEINDFVLRMSLLYIKDSCIFIDIKKLYVIKITKYL